METIRRSQLIRTSGPTPLSERLEASVIGSGSFAFVALILWLTRGVPGWTVACAGAAGAVLGFWAGSRLLEFCRRGPQF